MSISSISAFVFLVDALEFEYKWFQPRKLRFSIEKILFQLYLFLYKRFLSLEIRFESIVDMQSNALLSYKICIVTSSVQINSFTSIQLMNYFMRPIIIEKEHLTWTWEVAICALTIADGSVIMSFNTMCGIETDLKIFRWMS